MKMIQAFICLLAIPVLSVLYVGLIGSALLSIVAGILRSFGFQQIGMSIWLGVSLPVVLSIPFSLLFSLLFFYCSIHVKRCIPFCIAKLKF